jgi:hypothetical protein
MFICDELHDDEESVFNTYMDDEWNSKWGAKPSYIDYCNLYHIDHLTDGGKENNIVTKGAYF